MKGREKTAENPETRTKQFYIRTLRCKQGTVGGNQRMCMRPPTGKVSSLIGANLPPPITYIVYANWKCQDLGQHYQSTKMV